MKKTHFGKAHPIGKGTVESEAVVFDQELPEFKTLESARKEYRRQAEVLELILFEVLAGGMYDQVLAAMLAHKASLLRVPHFGTTEKES